MDDLADLRVLVLLDDVDLAPEEWQRRLLVELALVAGARVVATVGRRVPDNVMAHLVDVPPARVDEAIEFLDGDAKTPRCER